MNKGLVKIGATGSIITGICCFTPVLVWVLALVGLSAVAPYLDYALFSLLALFIVLILIGLMRKKSKRAK